MTDPKQMCVCVTASSRTDRSMAGGAPSLKQALLVTLNTAAILLHLSGFTAETHRERDHQVWTEAHRGQMHFTFTITSDRLRNCSEVFVVSYGKVHCLYELAQRSVHRLKMN